MGSQKGIQDLPNELLEKIFSYLSCRDLVYSVPYVNERWLGISRVNSLWKNRSYTLRYRENDCSVSHMLKKTPMLQSLILSRREVGSNVLNAFMVGCPKLKRLEFNICQRLSSSLLKTMVQKCPDIEILSIPMQVLNNMRKAEIIGTFRNLKVLCVGGLSDRGNPVYLKPLADGCPALQAIDLRCNTYTDDDLSYFLTKKKHQLLSLSVSWSSAEKICSVPRLTLLENLETLSIVCGERIQNGFDSFRNLKSVTSLTLALLIHSDINYVMRIFDQRAMSQLLELCITCYFNYEDTLTDVIVKNCPNLRSIHIEDCTSLTDQSVVNFPSLNDLQRVNLSGSSLSDEGVVHLGKCRNLTHLILKSCEKLTGRNLVTGFAALKVLNLDFCDNFDLPLRLIPSALKHLTLLSVKYCKNVDQDAVKELKLQMPQLCIRRHFAMP